MPLLWLSVYAAAGVAGTLAWTLAGAVLDARQAKRLFPMSLDDAVAYAADAAERVLSPRGDG